MPLWLWIGCGYLWIGTGIARYYYQRGEPTAIILLDVFFWLPVLLIGMWLSDPGTDRRRDDY